MLTFIYESGGGFYTAFLFKTGGFWFVSDKRLQNMEGEVFKVRRDKGDGCTKPIYINEDYSEAEAALLACEFVRTRFVGFIE